MEGQEPGPGHIAEFIGRISENMMIDRPGWDYRQSGIWSYHSIRWDTVPSCEGRKGEKQRRRENQRTTSFTASYNVKKNLRHRPFHHEKIRLHSNLSPVYNPRTKSGFVCTVCNRWRFSIICDVRSHGTTRTLFFDVSVRHTPAGRQRCNGRP